MLPTASFRQLACLAPMRLVASEEPYKSIATIQKAEYNERGLGLLIALGLHLAWFGLMPNSEKPQPVTPPQPIMVQWIGDAQTQQAPAKPPVQQAQPTPEKTVSQPKTPPKPVKKPNLVSTASQASAAMAAPEPTPEPPRAEPAPTAATAAPAPAPSSASTSEATSAPMTLPTLNADYLNNPAPAYPSASRQLGEQGKVLLRVLVNTDGAVEQVTLRKSSGFDRLDQAAQDTVQKWRFVPARRGEQVVSAWVVVPVSFSLEG
ncbi:energy transducer TonB [Methylomonas sp. LW13]|uniref:energy transducer TonB n=1 Tax=unclassified Methylomonas TaxID=2608980 RepID=UPI00051AE3A2|nr:energy transducer TonB [Methylomonas sp. LW13]QBC28326.1 energy transducer TonB [Methylomonas sp. LW13]